MRRSLAFCTLCALLLPGSSAIAQNPVSPAAQGIAALWAYAGTWQLEMTHLATPYSKPSREAHTLQNDCWKSGDYVACRQIVDGDPKILLVFTFDDKAGTYTSYQIPPHGGDAGHGKLLIVGNTWTFPWESTEGGKTTYFRVVNVWSSATTIEFRQEYSTDQKTWTQMATGHETKVAEK